MMRSRKIVVCLFGGFLLLSGCGIFQNVKKQKDSSYTASQLNAVRSTLETDTGSGVTRKTWFGTTPQIEAAVLKSFEMAAAAATSAASAAKLKGNAAEMTIANLNLRNATGDLMDFAQTMGLGYQESSMFKNGTSKASNENVEQKTEQKEDHSTKEKNPDYGALFIGGGIAILILLVCLIALGIMFKRLSNKVNGITGIFNAVK